MRRARLRRGRADARSRGRLRVCARALLRAATSHKTGYLPAAIAVQDLIPHVSVFVNRGHGSFLPRRDVPAGPGTASVAIGDLGGDGKPDRATASAGGDGVRPPGIRRRPLPGKARLQHGKWPISSAVADLNGDGKPDVATTDQCANAISVLIKRGDGSVLPKRDYRTNRYPSSISAGDLDRERTPGARHRHGSVPDRVSVLHNDDGTFAARTDRRAGGWGNHPVTATIGDVNGDGHPDVVTANTDIYSEEAVDIGIVTVLLKAGGGRLFPRREARCRDRELRLRRDLDPHERDRPLRRADGQMAVARQGEGVAPARRLHSGDRAPRLRRKTWKDGVISEWPRPGTVLPGGAKVDLVVGGRRRR